MAKDDDTIEKLTAQIKKLEKKIELAKTSDEKEEKTKFFDGDEETDTKIFDNEKSVTELLDLKENKLGDDEVNIENMNETSNIKEEKIVEDNKKVVSLKEKKKKYSVSIIIVILSILILIILILCGLLIYDRIGDKDLKNTIVDEKELTDDERRDAVKSYGETIEGIIGVYFSKQNILLNYEDAVKLVEFDEKVKCSVHEIYKDGKLYLNKCSVNGIKTDASYGEKIEEVVSSDEFLDVYVNKISKIATLSKPKKVAEYDKYTIHCGGIYYDPELLSSYSDYVFYFDSEYKVQMKNYKTDERVFSDLQYDELQIIRKVDNSYDTNYVAVRINGYWGIYNLEDNIQVISPMYSWFSSAASFGVGVYSYISTVDDNLIIANDGKNYGLINYTNNKAVIPFDYSQLYKSGNYIWAKNDNNGYIYDNIGNKYLADSYEQIYGMIDGIYILVRDVEEIKLVQIDGKILYNYGKIEDMGGVNYSLSYNNGALFQIYTSDSENYSDCIEILYDPSTKEGTYKKAMCGGMAKPVLYLYPEVKTDVIVSFDNPEILETTYPKYVGRWQVSADNEGNLTDRDGKKYYALYWDEKRVHEVDFSEGFYVEKDEAITFLEEKLNYIGLNDYERNEFIMYWLPILEKNGKSLVYFELTDERESYNKINISPKVDSLLRVGIHVKRVDKKVNIKRQSLVRFQRKGFVAVEWGGMIY